MENYVISPMTEIPYMYEDDYYYEKYAGTDTEVIRDVDFADEQAFVNESMELETPHPPLSLLDEDPLEYVMEFMFLQRPARLRECDWEFWCLHWQPVTFRILEICTEYCSQKNVDLMNETAELERASKNLGPRRTAVLTPEVYEAQTIARTRNPPKGEEPWDRDDHIWCICEAVKLFPKNLSKNQRFKERLGLPIPGEDYEVIRGNVRNELETLRNRPASASVVKKKATPASKVGGVRRKAARAKTNNRNAPNSDDDDDYNDTVATLAASRRSPFIKQSDVAAVIASSSGNNKRNPSKRAIQKRSSEDEFIPGNFASPKKKAKAMSAATNNRKAGQQKPAAAAADSGSPKTPARGRKKTRFTAAEESKAPKGRGITVKGEDDVVRTLGSPIQFQDPATFAPDSDSDGIMSPDEDDVELTFLFEDDLEVLSLGGLNIQYDYESGYESDQSDKTITQDKYVRKANKVNGGL